MLCLQKATNGISKKHAVSIVETWQMLFVLIFFIRFNLIQFFYLKNFQNF